VHEGPHCIQFAVLTYVIHVGTCTQVTFVFAAVMQPPSTPTVDINTYRARKYASMQGRGNRTGLKWS